MKTAHEIRRERLTIMGFPPAFIETHCHSSLEIDLFEEAKELSEAIELQQSLKETLTTMKRLSESLPP